MPQHVFLFSLLLAVTCFSACNFIEEFNGKKKEVAAPADRSNCLKAVVRMEAIVATPVPTPPAQVSAELCRSENLKCDQTIFTSDDGVTNETSTEAQLITVQGASVPLDVVTVTIPTAEAVKNNPSLFQDLNYVEARCFLGSDIRGQSDTLEQAAKLALDECNLRR